MRRLVLACALAATLTPAAAQSLADLPINCALKPLQTIELSSEIPGIVKEVLVRPGAEVRKGEILMRLDTDLVRLDLDLARQKAGFTALLDAAIRRQALLEKRVDRLKRGVGQKAVSSAEYEDAVRELELAKAEIATQRQELRIAASNQARAAALLEKSEIRSPEDGVVGEELANVGESVAGGPVATLYVTRALRAEAFVPLQLLGRIGGDHRYALVVNGDRANRVPVTLDYISPVANLASKTISVFFLVDAKNVISGNSCLLEIS